MGSKKEATKKKIIGATLDLLDQSENPEDLTVRKIAEAAGIGPGLINYHYQSRDNLINEAVSIKLMSLAAIMEQLDGDMGDPVKYLKEMLTALSDIAAKNHKFSHFSMEYRLLKGDYQICLYLLPVLKKIYNGSKSETDLRLTAFQIIAVMQSVYLGPESFHMLTGINVEIKNERDNLIYSIVDNLIR